jgi:predicted nucleotidyltransferase
MGLLGLIRLRKELAEILGANVDLVPAGDLKPGIREAVEADQVPL